MPKVSQTYVLVISRLHATIEQNISQANNYPVIVHAVKNYHPCLRAGDYHDHIQPFSICLFQTEQGDA